MLYHRIDFTKKFTKQFTALKPPQKRRFYERLELFQQNPHAKILRNHALKGKFVGYNSIDIQGDLRALYYVEQDLIIIFAFIGTHSQIY